LNGADAVTTGSTSSPEAQQQPREGLERGLVIRLEGGFYTVQHGALQTLCTLAKRLRRGQRTQTNPLAIGDDVGVRAVSEEQGIIEEIFPRRNELVRAAPGREAVRQVLAANLDLLLVVTALRLPPPSLARVDRFLVIAAQSEIPTAIIVTKTDLGAPGEAEAVYGLYRGAGYALYPTSIANGEGVAAVREALAGRASALIGASGSGKSSLLNAVQPGLRLREGDLSESTGKGRHTTVVAELIPLTEGGYVADTPGLRGIEPHDLDPDILETYMPEFGPYLGHCRFSPCSHLHEPGCAVRAAVAAGAIVESRYDSYVKLYEEARLNLRPEWGR